MRVIHLSTLHAPLDPRIFQKECRTLAAAGHDVHFLVADAPDAPVEGVNFHRLAKPNTRFRPLRICSRLLTVYRQAEALKGDVYHFHDPELIVVGLLLKRAGARVIYDVHEDAPREALSVNKDRPWNGRVKSWAWSLLESTGRQVFDGFVCATPAIARRFPARRTVTVQNYPLLEEFPSTSLSQRGSTINLVYVGGISAIRGAREMVRLLEPLRGDVPIRLVLAGPVFPPALLEELATLPAWAHVKYLGHLARTGVQKALGQAHIGLLLLHPERIYQESLPVKLFEYMAAGLPVVASDFPLWRGILTTAGCGLTVNPLDPTAIAAVVRYLIENPNKAIEMGRRGREAVHSHFNWQPEANKLLDLYQSLEAA